MSLIYVRKVGVVDGVTVVINEEDDGLYVLAPVTAVSFGKKNYDTPSVEIEKEV